MLPVLTDIVIAASSAVAAFAFTSFASSRRRAIDLKVLDSLPGTLYQRLLLTHVALTVEGANAPPAVPRSTETSSKFPPPAPPASVRHENVFVAGA